MPNKSSGVIRHPGFRSAVIAKTPESAIEPVHVLGLSSQDADGHASSNDLAVGREVGLDAKVFLSSTQSDSQSGDHFVEDQCRRFVFGHSREFLHERFGL